MENNYIIHDGNRYITADEHENILKEYEELKKKCESIITENAELRTKSEIDPLSKVYRRGAAIEKITQLLKGGMKSCALIVMDLDNFKYVNDTFGHNYGDAVITTVSECITKEIADRGIVGRFGGDEFLVFMPGADEDEAMEAARNIIATIDEFNTEPNAENKLTCSAGVAVGSGNVTYNSLFKMADKALYSAKHNGKSHAELYNHTNMGDIREACLTYVEDEEITKNPYSDVVSRAIEMASRAGTTEDAIYALFSHIAMNFGIISATVLTVDVSKDMITVNYGYKLNSEAVQEGRRKNNVGYYFHQDLILFRDMLTDRMAKHLPQSELTKLSNKLAREVCDDELAHRLLYMHKSDNGNYSICSFIVPGPVKFWGEDELKAISEISAIIMVYADRGRYISKHEESLQERLDTDKLTGAYSMQKFYETSGLIRKLAVENNIHCYLLSTKLKSLRKFNRTYSMSDGDKLIVNYYKSLDESPYRQNGITAHDSSKFITIIRTTETAEVVKKSYMELAKKFIDGYAERYPECPVEIAIGIVEVFQDDVLAVKIDEAYYDRTLVE